MTTSTAIEPAAADQCPDHVDPLHLLLTRRSPPLPLLGEPGPDGADLTRILTAAIRVPDHGRLTPWRLQIVRGEARERLRDAILAAYREEAPDAKEPVVAKLAAMPLIAPVVVVVSSRLQRDHKVPVSEQRLSAGALCQNLGLAAHALGYRAHWLTGWAAYSGGVKRALRIPAEEDVYGFVLMGTSRKIPDERPRPALADVATEWTGT